MNSQSKALRALASMRRTVAALAARAARLEADARAPSWEARAARADHVAYQRALASSESLWRRGAR